MAEGFNLEHFAPSLDGEAGDSLADCLDRFRRGREPLDHCVKRNNKE